MPTTSPTRPQRTAAPLALFTAIAVPAGWLLLSLPLVLGLPQEPFILLTLVLGLIAPALFLTARESGRDGVRALLRDVARPPTPWWWGALAVLTLPTLVWASAAALGGAVPLTPGLVGGFAITLTASLLIVNLWEEMAWTGFAQRRAMVRWGPVGGSLVTGVLFAGIHLPLAFDDASTAADVLSGVLVLLLTAVGLRLLVARLELATGGSLLAVGLLHASFNASAELVDPSHGWVQYVVTILLGLVVVPGLARAPGR